MNLKEAFRYQNKLQQLSNSAQCILSDESNVTRVETTLLLHKVNPDAQDETTTERSPSEYAESVTEMAMFLMFLLEQREALSYAIRKAKSAMEMDFDGEVSLNHKRRELAEVLREMSQIRCSETVYPGSGMGYKFNAEGNQVSYRCDMKRVTSIRFDRNKIRSLAAGLSKKADAISAQLDRQTVNGEVDYRPPFDVNDSFADIFQWYLEQI